MIVCIEEVAIVHKFINIEQYKRAIKRYSKSKYGQYCQQLLSKY